MGVQVPLKLCQHFRVLVFLNFLVFFTVFVHMQLLEKRLPFVANYQLRGGKVLDPSVDGCLVDKYCCIFRDYLSSAYLSAYP